MNLETALSEINRLSKALEGSPTAFEYRVFCPSGPFKDWYKTWHKTLFGGEKVSAPEVKRYGVYLLATVDREEVIYVGKATPGNQSNTSSKSVSRYHLGAEIWNKLPTQRHDGPLISKKNLQNDVKQALKSYDIYVAAVEILPWQLAACVESYLHAVVSITDGKPPAANDHIG